jgi:hypothetical protein
VDSVSVVAAAALEAILCGGFLSLFHGPGYVGHQLFQIVLGGFRRLCVAMTEFGPNSDIGRPRQ